MTDHAIYSASAAHRWMNCAGSINAEAGLPDTSSKYADEGTAAHGFASMILENRWTPAELDALVGIVGWDVDGTVWPLTQEMADFCWDYAKLVESYAEGGTMLIEQRVDYSRVIGQESAFGTSDVVILKPKEIIVIDLKYGMGEEVDVVENEQLQLYALGALEAHDFVYPFEIVTMVIHQVRLNSVKEWSVPVDVVRAFGPKAEAAATATLAPDAPRTKGAKQCRWCKAKHLCPEIVEEIDVSVIDDFKGIGEGFDLVVAEPDRLAYYMGMTDLVEGWVKAVRAEVERRLTVGIPVEGYKLVAGKQGDRKWVDDLEAEQALKKLRLKVDEMYTKKLITPPQLEKKLKTQRPKLWDKAQALITRSAGKPSVAPVTDTRAAITLTATPADFAQLPAPVDFC